MPDFNEILTKFELGAPSPTNLIEETPVEKPVEDSLEPVTPLVEKPAEPVAATVEDTQDEWDTDDEPAGTVVEDVVPVVEDYSLFKETLGQDFKSKDEISTYLKSLKEENEKLKSSNDIDKILTSANLPSELADAIKIQKEGGDYLSYLKIRQVDYDILNDNEIIELTQRELFNEGPEGDQEFIEYLESKKPVEIKLEAKKIRQGLKAQQDQAINNIKAEAQRRKAENEKALKTTLDSKSEVRGFKLNERHKKSLYDSISSGEIQKELFLGENGKLDFNKVIDVYFSYKYADKIDSYYKTKIQNSTKRSLLDELSNTDLNSKGSAITPEGKKDAFSVYLETIKSRK
jgi:hypothetical protein